MCPPEINKHRLGKNELSRSKISLLSLIRAARICPSRWLTPIKGTSKDMDNPFAKLIPTNRDPANPGP